MKGDATVIEFLNKALTNELTAINQYWLHYRVLADWGVHKLAEYERHESIDEMKHADILAERVLFLGGLPNFQAIHKLKVGESVEEILKADLAVEHEAIPLLKDAIEHCEKVRDYVSREIFARILESEEEHVDFLETQFDMIERMGLENYVQLQSKAAGEGEG
ncbi:bacterioferritin [Altererythrobacter lutimaris]|uniref:Bacterioferritin n=1 Tax=Altererythrobacter lutimaris TaxID=2743979 RepID=A0A850H6F2_9SPHN|nr:bacterioferritin [Altererythrobacter lutimaris]NVE94824.1 bacterioferritin [Altererythrobacter lutimaris]